MRCQRCDYTTPSDLDRTDSRDDLASHAQHAAHPLCGTCRNSLTEHEPATCERCLTRGYANLSAIVDLYATLPDHLGQLGAIVYDRDRRPTDEQHLPGGDVLVMLAGGSEGTGETLGETTFDDDPDSVPQTLARLEDDWRHTRQEPGAVIPNGAGGFTDRTVWAASGYLERHMRWAANNHPCFPDALTELRRLRARLEDVSRTGDRVVRANAPCFDCGEHALERHYQPATGINTTHQAGGLEDDWTCARCHRRYTQAEYWLAVRGHLEAG